MRKFFSFVTLFSLMLCAYAQSISIGNYTGSESLAEWGTSKSETYSVAMKINHPELVGMKIVALKVPVNYDAVNVSDHVAFLSRELTASSGRATGDILNIEFTPEDTWTTITLDEPYVIQEAEFYAGYSFKMSKCDLTTGDGAPLMLMVGVNPEGLMITTSRTYRRWTDASEAIGGSVAMQLVVQGDDLKENSVSIGSVSDKRVAIGEASSLKALLLNHGVNAVSGIGYKLEVAGQVTEGIVDVSISADSYGQSAIAEIPVPAISELGTYEATVTVVSVNGEVNNGMYPSAICQVCVMNVVPVKRPLMEEFTGTWCGFCPSGYVAMKLMNERHPGEFICASYHNMDAMEITTNYPVFVDAFPTATIDRFLFTDPYLGEYRHDMGIERTWLDACDIETPVNVNVSASLDVTTGVLVATAEVLFCEDVDDADFGIAYVVTADSLAGNGANWRQHNYYSNEFEGGAYSNTYIEGMEQFNQGAEYQYLAYDDVVIAQSHGGGDCFTGMFSASHKEGDVVSHDTSFNTADMKSDYGSRANLVQNTERLSVIAVVVNSATKAVVNCAKCHVQTGTSAITSVADGSAADVAQAYDLSGRPVQSGSHGLMIVRTNDGRVVRIFK